MLAIASKNLVVKEQNHSEMEFNLDQMKKIAFPTDDGETISRHLGESQFYIVALLDDIGNVTFERREKPHHQHDREEPGR